MSAFFVGANTQYLVNSSPTLASTGYPFTVGMWYNLTAVGAVTRTLFAFSDTGTTNNYLRIIMNSSEAMQAGARAGSTESQSTAIGAVVAGTWAFIVVRFLASNNRRIMVLDRAGLVSSTASVTSRAPTGLDTMTIGALSTSGGITDPWDGAIAEYWLANADIYPDVIDLDQYFFRQLAYGGPFSIPLVAKNIVEWHSFRCGPDTTFDNLDETYFGTYAPPNWVNTNAVSLGPHPPLPYWFQKPTDTSLMAMI